VLPWRSRFSRRSARLGTQQRRRILLSDVPGVESDVPGTCPKCGMALEAAMPTLAAGEDPELVDMRRRFWIALA